MRAFSLTECSFDLTLLAFLFVHFLVKRDISYDDVVRLHETSAIFSCQKRYLLYFLVKEEYEIVSELENTQLRSQIYNY